MEAGTQGGGADELMAEPLDERLVTAIEVLADNAAIANKVAAQGERIATVEATVFYLKSAADDATRSRSGIHEKLDDQGATIVSMATSVAGIMPLVKAHEEWHAQQRGKKKLVARAIKLGAMGAGPLAALAAALQWDTVAAWLGRFK